MRERVGAVLIVQARTDGYARQSAPHSPSNRTLWTYPRQGFHEPVGMLDAAGETKIGTRLLSVCVDHAAVDEQI